MRLSEFDSPTYPQYKLGGFNHAGQAINTLDRIDHEGAEPVRVAVYVRRESTHDFSENGNYTLIRAWNPETNAPSKEVYERLPVSASQTQLVNWAKTNALV